MEQRGTDLASLDFSMKAVSRAIRKTAVENPLVIWPPVVGVIGTVAVLVLGAPWMLVLPLGMGASAFGIKYFLQYDAEAAKYLRAMRNLQQQFVAEIPAHLEADLKAANSERGLMQLRQLEHSFADLHQLLERKFSSRGMTLGRFLGTAEQVRAGALYKLQMVLDLMKAVESIPADLEEQIRDKGQESDEVRLVCERVHHREEALEKIEHLHIDVEESLTRLSEISIRIANVGMDEDKEVEFESYLHELQTLASQASTFRRET